MKPFMRLSLLLVIAIASCTSCKKSSPKQTKFIPKEASFVATVNTKSLKDKLVESQATFENFLKSLTNDTTFDKGKKEWEDLKNSGIDLEENIYVSMVQKGGGMNMAQGSSTVSAVVGGLDDASKFEAYIKKKDSSITIQKDKDFTYAQKEDNMVAWGKDVIIFMSYNKAPAVQIDTADADYEVKPVQAITPVDVKAEMTAYFNLKEDESMASIAEFRDLTAQKADGSLWINSAASLGEMPIPLPKVKELFAKSYSAATVNFEDGKVVMNSKTYSSDALNDIMEQYSGSTVNLDLIKNYPSNNIDGFFVASFNPDFFNGIVKYLEVGGFVDGFIKKTLGPDYTMQDVLKSIKGDVAIVLSDVDTDFKSTGQMGGNDVRTNTMSMNWGKILLNIPVGDKVQFNRLMDKLVEQQMMVKTNNEYKLSPMLSSMGFKVSLDDKNFLIASDSAVISQYKSGATKSNIDAALIDGFKGKSSAGYLNMEKIMSNVKIIDSTNAESLAIARGTFKNIRGYTENFNGKHIEGHMEINMKNEKENSLTSLLKFLSVQASDFEKRKANSPRATVDTAVVGD